MSKSMNLDKVSKVESNYTNRNSIGRFLESSSASKPSGSKNDISPREDAVKNSLEKFPNKRLNVISDGSKTLKSNLSSKPILCSSGATKPSPSNPNEVKTSATNSVNTTKIWNAYCRRLLCSFGGSKSKSSDLGQVKEKSVEGTSKIPHDCRNELRELMARSFVASPKNGSSFCNNKGLSIVVGQSTQQSNPSRLNKVQPVTVLKKQIKMTAIPNDPQNLRKKVQKSEVSTVATRMREIQKTEGSKASIIANPKREIQKTESSKGSMIATPKREILITEGSKASMIATPKMEIQKTESSKGSITATLKREIQKTEGSKGSMIATPKREILITEGSKASMIATTKREIQKTEGSKGSMSATQKRENQKTEGSKASLIATTKREIQKPEGSMIAIPKRGISNPNDQKDSTIATQKREAPKKTSGSKVLAVPDKKKICMGKTSTLLSSHDKKNQPSSSQYRPYSDIPVYHIKWDGHDKKSARTGHICILCNKDLSCLPQNDYGSHEDDEYEYRIELRPRLLPCADVLPCGHVFHSDCLRFAIPEEQSTDPQCVFCLSMA